MKTFETKNISVTIRRPFEEVYNFVSDPQNVPQWASGLSDSTKVTFADKNQFGVVDHDVTLSTGKTVHIPMRIIPNNDGSDIVFTLHKLPNMSDQKFIEDQKWIQKDLNKLKKLLE